MRRTFFLILLFGILVGFFLRNLLPQKPVAAKLVVIKSRNLEFQVATTAKTVGEVLGEQGFLISTPSQSPPYHGGEKNVLFGFSPFAPSLIKEGEGGVLEEEGVVAGMTIEVLKAVKVLLVDAGNEQELTTSAATVGDFLNQQKIGLAATDQVKPPLESFLGEGLVITIDRIVDLEVTEVHDIPYEIKLEYDPDAYYGREEIVSSGKAGRKEQEFLITYKNGVEVKRKLLAQKILENPVTEIRKFGTKIEVEIAEEGRASWYAYKKCMCAAHPFYELGRYVRVTSISSGKSIIVRINDRGPDLSIHPDRVIDLDSVAFRELAPLGAGTIGVRVELLRY